MSKFNLTKCAGGTFIPASDIDAEKLQRFKTGLTYEVEIKEKRNQRFHGKCFAFLTYCFEFYFSESVAGNVQKFDWFREELTKAAGFYDVIETPRGTYKRAKSLSYGSMSQEEFEAWYKAVIQVAITTIFKNSDDPNIYDKLISFF